MIDDDLADDRTAHTWEEEYKRSWDIFQEDEDGNLDGLVDSLQHHKKRKHHSSSAPVKRGIIRHLYLILDLSMSMQDLDLRPNRLLCTLSFCSLFINDFFDRNPLSQIGIIITRNGMAEKISELSPHPKDHIYALEAKVNRVVSGEISIQNSLELANASLVHIPKHASREILL